MGTEILDDIKESRSQPLGHYSLLNQAGYWLLAPDQEKEWGFMYPHRADVSFANRFPVTWEHITQNDSGLFYEMAICTFLIPYSLYKRG